MRAIGIVRVSEVAGRNGDRFHSPAIQRERIERDCRDHDLQLAEVIEELDVSGGKPIVARKGLNRALAAIESGQIGAIVFAYRDRMDRSIDIASELCRRMDQAGGLLIADGQIITHATHDGWRRATFESFLNEDQRRAISAKMRDVQAAAVAQGKVPFPIPPGYRRRDDGTAEPDPKTRRTIVKAWNMRADGTSMPVIRAWLAKRGISVSLGGLTRLLSNRFYLGELHYRREGVVPNLTAHEPIIDLDLYSRVQRTKGTLRGRTSKSEHLLARQGVLRCGTCGGRMSVSAQASGRWPFYRCTASDCSKRMTISARIAEEVVSAAVRDALRDAQGRASIAESAQEAQRAVSTAQEALDAALRVFSLTGAENEAAAVERLAELRQARDDAQARLDQIGPEASMIVTVTGDWDELNLAERRALIRATIASAVVTAGGRGAERIAVRLFAE